MTKDGKKILKPEDLPVPEDIESALGFSSVAKAIRILHEKFYFVTM